MILFNTVARPVFLPYTSSDNRDKARRVKRVQWMIFLASSNFTRLLGIVGDEFLDQFQGCHCKRYHVARPITSQTGVEVSAEGALFTHHCERHIASA